MDLFSETGLDRRRIFTIPAFIIWRVSSNEQISVRNTFVEFSRSIAITICDTEEERAARTWGGYGRAAYFYVSPIKSELWPRATEAF